MTHLAIWIISFLTIISVIATPFRVPEAIWAVTGALLLIILGLILPADGWKGVVKGLDVYLFLTGMMLLSETAREEGLFDWLAQRATALAGGSSGRLFFLIYGVGTLVTIFLSNDATAVVLTPAVAAAVRAAKVEKPLPYLLICAFIANAASFVLPISNPANLVIYGSHMPSLQQWVPRYILPSFFSIAITFLMLRLTQRTGLRQKITTGIRIPDLSTGGRTALAGIAVTAIILLAASALSILLGLPTAITGILTSAIVIIRAKKSPWIGIDLGPNLSVTGSLATILWLLALRREGQRVDAWTFLKLGVVVMIPALMVAIAALFI